MVAAVGGCRCRGRGLWIALSLKEGGLGDAEAAKEDLRSAHQRAIMRIQSLLERTQRKRARGHLQPVKRHGAVQTCTTRLQAANGVLDAVSAPFRLLPQTREPVRSQVQNRAKELAPQRSHPDSMAASLHAKKFTPTRCGDCKEMTGCDVVNHNVAVLVHTLTGPQHAKGVLLRNYNPCTGRKHQPQVHPAMHTACKWRSVTHCVHRIPGPCRCELQRAYSGW